MNVARARLAAGAARDLLRRIRDIMGESCCSPISSAMESTMRHRPIRLRWAGMILGGLLFVAVAPAAAQQASRSAPAAALQAPPAPVPEASAAQASVPTSNSAASGPRVSAPTFDQAEQVLPRSSASTNSSAAAAENHTIVISTLALVLIVIIVVLLVVK